MKKLISALLSMIIVMSAMAVPAMAEDNIKVTLNGQEIQFDVQPQIINERTMVPVRAIFEALGASVEWDQTTQTVTSKKGDTTISLAIDNPVMMVNDEQVTLDQSACIIDERTLVPVRAISEAYGTTVEWDQATQTVIIKSLQDIENSPKIVMYDDISEDLARGDEYASRGAYSNAIRAYSSIYDKNLSPEDKVKLDKIMKNVEDKYVSLFCSNGSWTSFTGIAEWLIETGDYNPNRRTYTIIDDRPELKITLTYTADTSEIVAYTEMKQSKTYVTLVIGKEYSHSSTLEMYVNNIGSRMEVAMNYGTTEIVHSDFPSFLQKQALEIIQQNANNVCWLALKSHYSLAEIGVPFTYK